MNARFGAATGLILPAAGGTAPRGVPRPLRRRFHVPDTKVLRGARPPASRPWELPGWGLRAGLTRVLLRAAVRGLRLRGFATRSSPTVRAPPSSRPIRARELPGPGQRGARQLPAWTCGFDRGTVDAHLLPVWRSSYAEGGRVFRTSVDGRDRRRCCGWRAEEPRRGAETPAVPGPGGRRRRRGRAPPAGCLAAHRGRIARGAGARRSMVVALACGAGVLMGRGFVRLEDVVLPASRGGRRP